MTREKKTIEIKLIIGILFLLILLIGASYAYFVVGTNTSEYNRTVITGSTEGTSIASIQNPIDKLNLNVDGAAMSLDNLGTIYADEEENYVKTKSEGFHDIGVITLKNSKKDDNIYRCTANVTITVDNGVNSILPVLEKDDLKVFIRWGAHYKIVDLSELKNTNGKITIPISLDIVGNNSKSIETYIELTNKETDQNYISGKDINIDIDTTDLKCELSGEKAVYLVGTTRGDSLGDKMGHNTDIKNIYFVNYIDTSNAVEEPVDLTNTNTRDKYYSPAGSVIGWLEEIPNENEEETQYYDLYIGSKNGTLIYATSLYYAFNTMSTVENIDFGNFKTDLVSSMAAMFYSLSSVTKLDVSKFDTSMATNMSSMFNSMTNLQEINISNFNTKNVTTMENMFKYLENVENLDVSNFNTSKVINMNSMFIGMESLTELDVSNFYTGNVTSMSGMFRSLTSISEINLLKFDTSKVKKMDLMFMNSNFKNLNLSSFDTSFVVNMHGMFHGMKNIYSLNLTNFNTISVNDISDMFNSSSNISTLDLSNFDTSNVTSIKNMFQGMSSLKYLDLSNAKLIQIETYYDIFDGVASGITIIAKDEENRDWIQERLNEKNKKGTVLLPNEIKES